MRFNLQKDINKKTMWFFILVLVTLKLVLLFPQPLMLEPQSSPIDDTLMFEAARSLSGGEWFGEYDWLTISKNMFFALWLSALNFFGIPFLLGGNLLWGAACVAVVVAFSPVVKNNALNVAFFAVMWFNPAATASFNSRVYRDNIFPSLCTLVFAGIIGFAFRYQKPVKKNIWFLIYSGVSFSAAYLTREDGFWLVPFVLVALATVAFFILFDKNLNKKILRVACLAIPFVLVFLSVSIYSFANYNVYGKYVSNELMSEEFSDAYGAIIRTNPDKTEFVVVPKQTREALYDLSPSFAKLEPFLETDFYYDRYGFVEMQEYSPPGLLWALREAASEAGMYQTATMSAEYWRTVADEINELCDSGAIPSKAFVSGTSMPFRSDYVVPLLVESAKSFVACAIFYDTDARVDLTFAPPELIAEWESYLGNKAVSIAKTNTALPYYNPFQQVMYFGLDVIRYIYMVLSPVMLVFAFLWFAPEFKRLKLYFKQGNMQAVTVLFVMLGVLLSIVLRVAMVSYHEVSSANLSVFMMYLSSVHPLMLMFGFAGSCFYVANNRGVCNMIKDIVLKRVKRK